MSHGGLQEGAPIGCCSWGGADGDSSVHPRTRLTTFFHIPIAKSARPRFCWRDAICRIRRLVYDFAYGLIAGMVAPIAGTINRRCFSWQILSSLTASNDAETAHGRYAVAKC